MAMGMPDLPTQEEYTRLQVDYTTKLAHDIEQERLQSYLVSQQVSFQIVKVILK